MAILIAVTSVREFELTSMVLNILDFYVHKNKNLDLLKVKSIMFFWQWLVYIFAIIFSGNNLNTSESSLLTVLFRLE